MSGADLEAKFSGLAGAVLPAAGIGESIDLCWRMAGLPDAGALARAAVPRDG